MYMLRPPIGVDVYDGEWNMGACMHVCLCVSVRTCVHFCGYNMANIYGVRGDVLPLYTFHSIL